MALMSTDFCEIECWKKELYAILRLLPCAKEYVLLEKITFTNFHISSVNKQQREDMKKNSLIQCNPVKIFIREEDICII